MKSLVNMFAAAAVAVVVSAGAAKAEDVIKFGVAAEDYKPFTSKDTSGKWVGWEVDLMDAVCKEMKVKCELVPTSWDGIIPALTSKKIDVIWSSMSITDERKKTIDFTDKYYNTPTVIIGPKDAKFGVTKDDLKGKIIGVQISTVHQAYVTKYYAEVAKEIKTYQTQDEANNDLAAGRVDAVQADSIALNAFLITDQGACCDVKGTVPEDVAVLGLGVGGGIRKEDTDLKGKFNDAIKAVRASGEYKTITDKYKADFGDIDLYGG